jgi:hypothetical protein
MGIIMAERNWSFINCLGYLYNAFAIYTDADLDEAEKKEIFNCVSEWAPESTRTEVMECLDLTVGWFFEDIEATEKDDFGTDKDKIIQNVAGICSGINNNVSEEKTKQAIVDDLARIGRADGHYDDVEKTWAKIVAENLGVNIPQ